MGKKIKDSWYDAAREAYGEKPLDVHGQLNTRTAFYKGYLYRLAVGKWRWAFADALNWNMSYIQSTLLLGGAFAVVKYRGMAVPIPFSVLKRNMTHLPLEIASTDGEISGTWTVGKDSEIVTLGFEDLATIPWSYREIIDIYAEKLANCDASIDINLMNTRTPFLFEASDSHEAENLKAVYSKIMDGEPAIYWRSVRAASLLDSRELPITVLPVKQNYIVDLIMEAKKSIIAEYKTAIGYNNVDYEKKERLITDEVNANNSVVDYGVKMWADNVAAGVKKVNKLFEGVNLVIEYIKEEAAHEDEGRAGGISDKEED